MDQRNYERVPDTVIRILCAINGQFFALSKSKRLKVISLVMLFSALLVDAFFLHEFLKRNIFLKTEPLSFSQLIVVLNVISFSIVCLHWRLIFILRNDDFGFVLQNRGRRLRDMAFTLFCVSSIQVLHIEQCFGAEDWSNGFIEFCFLYFDFTVMSFFLLFDDAINNILKVHAQLGISTGAAVSSEAIRIILLKCKIRKLVKKANKLFALPLATFYCQIVMTVLFIFSSVDEGKDTTGDVTIFSMLQACFIFTLFHTARKASIVAARSVELESLVITQITGGSQVEYANLLSVIRFREEWDVLRVACFPLSVANLLRFLAFCITCVAVILQFDFKIVRALNRMSSLP